MAQAAIGLPSLPKATVTVCFHTDPSEYPIRHEADAWTLALGGPDTVLGSQYATVTCPSPSASAVSPPPPIAIMAISRARLPLFAGAADGAGTGVT